MIEQEIEKKALLTEAQYEILLNKVTGHPIKKTNQINYYYDTENYAMLSNNETLRVRQIENHLELHFKHDKKTYNCVRVSKELCEELQCLPEMISINGLFANYTGFLLTERTIIKLNMFTIFLDKNYYMGKVDYEIEIEAVNICDMPKKLFGIIFNSDCNGKYTRFVAELLKQRGCYEIS